MDQRKVNPAILKKPVRPKSAFLSWMLNNALASATTGENEGIINKSNTTSTNNNNTSTYISDRLEIPNRDNYMMNSSFSTPTTIGPYTQLHSEYSNLTEANNNINTTGPEIVINSQSCDGTDSSSNEMVNIPNRRQSHLYTPFHDNSNEYTSDNNTNLSSDYYNSKRRSCYISNLTAIDAAISNSSLTRSATWQPSSSLSANECHNTNINTPGNNDQYIKPNNADIPARRTSRNYANNPEIQAKLDAMLNSDRALLLSSVVHKNSGSAPVDQLSPNNSSKCLRSTAPGNRTS